jgi:hypothetical protein
MPRAFSMSIQSETVLLRPALPWMAPGLLDARARAAPAPREGRLAGVGVADDGEGWRRATSLGATRDRCGAATVTVRLVVRQRTARRRTVIRQSSDGQPQGRCRLAVASGLARAAIAVQAPREATTRRSLGRSLSPRGSVLRPRALGRRAHRGRAACRVPVRRHGRDTCAARLARALVDETGRRARRAKQSCLAASSGMSSVHLPLAGAPLPTPSPRMSRMAYDGFDKHRPRDRRGQRVRRTRYLTSPRGCSSRTGLLHGRGAVPPVVETLAAAAGRCGFGCAPGTSSDGEPHLPAAVGARRGRRAHGVATPCTARRRSSGGRWRSAGRRLAPGEGAELRVANSAGPTPSTPCAG